MVAWAVSVTSLAVAEDFKLSWFDADVTPPIGHRLLTGRRLKAESVTDPLHARGFVLSSSSQKPLVYVSVDWVEIRNEAYDRWRDVLAASVGTTRERVLVSCIHQHDAPLGDLDAERQLRKVNSPSQIIDAEFHEKTVQSVAAAARESLFKAEVVTDFGIGQATLREMGSNRRFLNKDGTPNYNRMSAGNPPEVRAGEEGTIDPNLKTISFWNKDKPLLALSVYATHPMSYYGTASISADFPGMARERRQGEMPGVFQIYASGASGNVTVGKYNDGTPAMRPLLADRLREGMAEAWKATRKMPLTSVAFRNAKLELEPRPELEFSDEGLADRLKNNPDTLQQDLAALGISWRNRVKRGEPIDVPCLDFGAAQILLLPAEMYVEFQLFAQEVRPDSFVLVIGYGECGPGYIPIERAWHEKDGNLRDWCWVAPGSEERVKRAIVEVLKPK